MDGAHSLGRVPLDKHKMASQASLVSPDSSPSPAWENAGASRETARRGRNLVFIKAPEYWVSGSLKQKSRLFRQTASVRGLVVPQTPRRRLQRRFCGLSNAVCCVNARARARLRCTKNHLRRLHLSRLRRPAGCTAKRPFGRRRGPVISTGKKSSLHLVFEVQAA